MSVTEDGPSLLDDRAYDAIRDAATTRREELVVRLGGEAGLRPTEIAAIRPADVTTRTHDGADHYFVTVPTRDEHRDAYLPRALADALADYVADADRPADEPVFPVSARRIQMLVSDVTDRAAAAADRPELAAVSSRDLRRYHARTLLVADGVDPRVVKAVGGWSQLETVVDHLDDPDYATIMASFDARSPTRDRDAAPNSAARRAALVDCVVSLGDALASVSTRDEIEEAAVTALAARYAHAWVADERAGTLELTEHEGLPDDATSLPRDLDDVATAVYETAEPTIRTGVADAWGIADATVGVFPLRHGGTTHGTFGVALPHDPGDVPGVERDLLADVGRRLGQSIAAVERQRLLLADTVLQLTLVSRDEHSFFVGLSEDLDCSLTLTGLVPGEDGSLLAFVWLEDAAPDAVFERANEAPGVASSRLIRTASDAALVEFLLTEESLPLALVDHGGSLTELRADDGTVTATAEFVPDVDVREVIEAVQAVFPSTEMVAKREVERSVQTDTEFEGTLEDALTPKQRSALQAAYHAGYFEWPRGSTAEELADSLGVTSPTFHNHLRRAQQKLLSTFLGDLDG